MIPFSSAHASTIVEYRGTTFVAFFAGSGEGRQDMAIWLYNASMGILWKVVDTPTFPNWNPVLFVRSDDGPLCLFYRAGPSPQNWKGRLVHLDWQKLDVLQEDHPNISGVFSIDGGPIKNKPIALSNGRVIAGYSTEQGGEWNCYASIAGQDLIQWINVKIDKSNIPGRGVIQPALWESEPGHVHMLMRSAMGKLCQSDSYDYGTTWCPAYPIDVPNNNSGIDLVHVDRTVYLVLNPISDPHISPRNRHCLEVWGLDELEKADGAPALVSVTQLENHTGFGPTGERPMEFSYPAIIHHGGDLLISYTYDRRTVKTQRLPLPLPMVAD